MDTKILREIQERFANDRYATVNGAVIEEVEEGYAKITMELDEHHYNAVGGVMGGAIFTIADFAFAVASNWQGKTVVSQTAQITYLGRAKGKKLIAEAKQVKDGRSMCYYVVEVTDELGSQVAHVTSSGFHVA
ncbi:MAG: PaaI family thioesterase [Eubacteriales bacterium]|nr:PaaI family thioesterase [Eubacteriales bacterium]